MDPAPKFPDPATIPLNKVYDVVVVGSGAAGGMAVFVLTAVYGLDVLLLEAGRPLDTTATLHSMAWPFDHPRRGQLPPDYKVLDDAAYREHPPPYGQDFAGYTNVANWQQLGESPDYTKDIFVNEREHPYTGTNFAWTRARVLGGRTTVWGRLALRLSPFDFKAKSRQDGVGDDWPIDYADLAPYYDRVDKALGISGVTEHHPWIPDSLYQRPIKLNPAEVHLRSVLKRSGRLLTPMRLGVATEGLADNAFRTPCLGRGACQRRVGGCDIHAAFDSPTGLIYPAFATRRLTVRTDATVAEVVLAPGDPHRVRAVRFIDTQTRQSFEAKGKAVVLAASTLESTRILLNTSSPHSKGLANSSGVLGCYLSEQVMGPRIEGFFKSRIGGTHAIEDGRPGGFYIPRFRNTDRKAPDGFLRGYGIEGNSGQAMVPEQAIAQPGFGSTYKQRVRDHAPAAVVMTALGEVLPRMESRVEIDPKVKDHLGIPVLRFAFRHGDNEKRMCADMAASMQEMFDAAGFETLSVSGDSIVEGSSSHEVGTARMGDDPRVSVLNKWCQSHDVKNLYVMDGACFVSAGCQNPTWTILALAWRASDHLAAQLKEGAL